MFFEPLIKSIFIWPAIVMAPTCNYSYPVMMAQLQFAEWFHVQFLSLKSSTMIVSFFVAALPPYSLKWRERQSFTILIRFRFEVRHVCTHFRQSRFAWRISAQFSEKVRCASIYLLLLCFDAPWQAALTDTSACCLLHWPSYDRSSYLDVLRTFD